MPFIRKRHALPVMVMALVACASTRIEVAWRAPDYDARITRMFVIGVSDNATAKRLYEQTLSRQLRERGVDAVAASSVLPVDRVPDRDMVRAAIDGKGYDAVLVTRVVDVQRDRTLTQAGADPLPQASHRNFYDYYQRTRPPDTVAPRVMADTIVWLETNVYATAGGDLVWAITSETFNPDRLDKVIDAYSRMIVNRLAADGLIAR